MNLSKQIILLSLLGLLLMGCDPELKREDKYARPDWLAGKVYTQLLDQPDLSTFAKCVELTGYDTIINRSGIYTIFAPNNEAFATWFQQHPDYNTVEDIPYEELDKLVKYHIIQNPWSKHQLRSLDVWGWIDTLDINNDEPKGFKRATLLLEKNRKLGVKYIKRDPNYIYRDAWIIDTLTTNNYRMYVTDSRKYAPIFFKEYFDIYDLNSDDYAFYFDRPFEGGDEIYFAGAKILGEEIFAENGFIYNVDRVVDPLKNAYEMVESGSGNQSYSLFLGILNQFPEFRYDMDKTFDQPGAEEGFVVDSLFNLTFPLLAFDILNERTTPPKGTYGLPSNVTTRYHHGMAAPTNEAINQLINDYLVGAGRWGSLEAAPPHITRIIANTHLSTFSIYPTDFEKGFINGEDDRVTVDQSAIVQKQFGSNATFVGISKAIVPRAFSSVTGPIYQQKGYSISMFAVEESGLLAALKRENQDYMLFVEADVDCIEDSSLLYDYREERFHLFTGTGRAAKQVGLNVNDLRTLILNHIGTRNPRGIARKEFIKNLAGNYLVINNETGEVTGTAPTTVRFKGSEIAHEFPEQISVDADNGATFRIRNWFTFSTSSLFQKLSSEYPVFNDLLGKAGLSNVKEYRYPFLSENENYTVFVPTDSALIAFRADTLSIPDLRDLLMLHFVQGQLIFTDGNVTPGYFETTRIDEHSTEFTTVFSKIYIDPGIDLISFSDQTGGEYLSVPESDVTNRMVGRSLGDGTEVIPVILINKVFHEIDRVLVFEELDSKY